MDELDKNNKWIFLIPIDGLSNKNISKNTIGISEDNNIEKDNSMEEDFNQYFYGNNINESDSNSNLNLRENRNNSKIYSYSFLSKSKIISKADSSKLHMSEYFKKNWKKKIKRLIIKLKKRFTKQSQKISSDNNINNLFDITNSENKNLNFDFYFSNNPNNFGHHHQNYQRWNYMDRNINYNINNLNISNS